MRIALSERVTVHLSKLGRLSAVADGVNGEALEGIHALLAAHCPDKMREHLRALHARCASGSRHASKRTRGYWQASLKSVLDAIQRMQGSPEMWAAIVELGLGELPAWAVSDLERDSQLNRDLRLMYRTGLSPEDAAVQLRALIDAEERRRDYAATKAVA